MNDEDDDEYEEDEDGSSSGGRNKYQRTKSHGTTFQMICSDFVRHIIIIIIIYSHEGKGEDILNFFPNLFIGPM